MKTACSGCGLANDRLPQRYCRACHATYARFTRPRSADLDPLQKQRQRARAYANEYQRRGLLVAQPCEGCGSLEVRKHHENYWKPLQVRWLCRGCYDRGMFHVKHRGVR